MLKDLIRLKGQMLIRLIFTQIFAGSHSSIWLRKKLLLSKLQMPAKKLNRLDSELAKPNNV